MGRMDGTKVTTRRRGRIFYGWWIAISAAVVHLYAGGSFFYGFTAFFTPIRETFGWSYAATSFAYVLQRLEGGILAPIAGYLVDKVGPRRIMLIGLSIAGLGFILFSRINSLMTFYGAFLVVATGMSLGVFSATTTAVANWFSRLRGRAMAVAYFGVGASGILIPLLVWLINTYGWRTTLVILGVGMWLVTLPMAFVMRHRPEQYGYLPDGETQESLEQRERLRRASAPEIEGQEDTYPPGTDFTGREALRTSGFWLVSLAFVFQHFGTSAVHVHIMPHLESQGFSRAVAGLAVTGMTLTSLLGRVGGGFLCDFFDKRYVVTIAFVLQVIGTLVFAYTDSVPLLILFLATYSPGYGGPIPVRPAIIADYFGRRYFGTVYGFLLGLGMAGGFASPVFAGWVMDVTGSYQYAFLIVAAVTALGIPCILLARPPRRPSANPERPTPLAGRSS